MAQMKHRGPDATGYLRHEHHWLGHNKLKILELDERSNQPFCSQDGRYAIVLDGVISNYLELAQRHNIALQAASVAEVVVELFVQHGACFLSWLHGTFAIVILDCEAGEVFAARDRLGVKPLYMCRNTGRLTLSSEIAPILELTGIVRFDEIGLRQYRKLRTFFNNRTLYEGIEMFPAGHYLQNGRLHRYWELPTGEQGPPSDEELRQLIEDAVNQCLIPDVPVGSYLSGGLDSSIVAALSQVPHTWTTGFADCNEFEWGRLVANHIGSAHHEILITPKEFLELAQQMIQRRREPLSVPNEVLIYKMTHEAKSHSSVLLSGEGADELFFGYDRIFRWAAGARQWDLAEFAKLYSYGTHSDLEIVEDALAPFLPLKEPLAIVSHFFQVAHLHGLLRRLDNSTMLCSVEARAPFVEQHPLIERMAGVPYDYRMQSGEIKAPLKRIFRDLIPTPVLQRT